MMTVNTSNTAQEPLNSSSFSSGSFQSIVQELHSLGQNFDQWAFLRRAQCIENKKQFNKTLSDQQELLKKLQAEIEHLHKEKAELDQVLQAEAKDEASLATQNDKLTAQINSQQQKLAEFREVKQKLFSSISKLSCSIQALKQEKIDIHSDLFPKVESFKNVLGLEITSPAVNLVKFVFFNLVAYDLEAKCWFTLEVAQNEGKIQIVEVFPSLLAPLNFGEEMLRSLASGKCDLLKFCAGFRAKFQEALLAERQNVNKSG
jgi:hypothetical protein